MGNEGFAMAAKKICKAWIPYKMTIKINQVIPYKMKGPNPAKFSNCMSRFLYDSDSILKSSILLLLQYGKVQVGSLHRKVKVDQLYGIVSSLTGTPLDQKVK